MREWHQKLSTPFVFGGMTAAHVKHSFAAIHFDMVDCGQDSACAVAVVRVEQGQIAGYATRLICPPRPRGLFEEIFQPTWETLQKAPRFGQVWVEIRPLVRGVHFLAAHQAHFQRGVMNTCCEKSQLKAPPFRWICTQELARQLWGFDKPYLEDVCEHLGIRTSRHPALSDALACAKVMLAAARHSSRPLDALLGNAESVPAPQNRILTSTP